MPSTPNPLDIRLELRQSPYGDQTWCLVMEDLVADFGHGDSGRRWALEWLSSNSELDEDGFRENLSHTRNYPTVLRTEVVRKAEPDQQAEDDMAARSIRCDRCGEKRKISKYFTMGRPCPCSSAKTQPLAASKEIVEPSVTVGAAAPGDYEETVRRAVEAIRHYATQVPLATAAAISGTWRP